MKLRRRNLLAGAAMFGGGLGAPAPGATGAARQDATRFAGTRDCAVLEQTIGEMQARSERDPGDPKGWRVHALAHHAVCAAVSNADDRQVHGCWWFLPWHRAFLAVTEWKLRALSGDPSLALPYWNWSMDRTLPAAFARAGSPLAHAARFTPDRALTPVEVDHLLHDPALARLGVAGLGARDFQAAAPAEIPSCFGGIAKPNADQWHGRSRLETVPHNAIHNYVGGEAADGRVGDMSELSTAAFDPVFYAHHANLDRLWEIWRGDPLRRATEPRDERFLRQQFPFPWIDGTVITVAVADTLDTRRLGYAYDSLDVFREAAMPAASAPAAGTVVASETIPVPRDNGPRRELRIAGVQQTDRPMSVEIAVAVPDAPDAAISVGAFATGRLHSAAVFPDTEPRFDISAVIGRDRPAALTVQVRSLRLGEATLRPPPFRYAGMRIIAAD